MPYLTIKGSSNSLKYFWICTQHQPLYGVLDLMELVAKEGDRHREMKCNFISVLEKLCPKDQEE